MTGDAKIPSTVDVASAWLRGKIGQKFVGYPFSLNIEINQDNQLKGIIYSRNLLTIMWYQLLRVVRLSGATQGKAKGRIPLKRCAHCKKWTSLRGRHDKDFYGEHGNWIHHKVCPTDIPAPTYL